jgi:hypothetical protein
MLGDNDQRVDKNRKLAQEAIRKLGLEQHYEVIVDSTIDRD